MSIKNGYKSLSPLNSITLPNYFGSFFMFFPDCIQAKIP
jgi:hypothetical protein